MPSVAATFFGLRAIHRLVLRQRKYAPACVVSDDIANEFGQVVTVVPTQRFSKERAGRAYMADMGGARSTLKEALVANASMVMSYDKNRVVVTVQPS